MKVIYAMPVKPPVAEKVPRVARLLALAHKFQKMLDSGEVESMAELGRLGRVSRARVTQIMDLLMLAPEIQEEVLFGRVVPLKVLTATARQNVWVGQSRVFPAGQSLQLTPVHDSPSKRVS